MNFGFCHEKETPFSRLHFFFGRNYNRKKKVLVMDAFASDDSEWSSATNVQLLSLCTLHISTGYLINETVNGFMKRKRACQDLISSSLPSQACSDISVFFLCGYTPWHQ